jgi:hypothetical protein
MRRPASVRVPSINSRRKTTVQRLLDRAVAVGAPRIRWAMAIFAGGQAVRLGDFGLGHTRLLRTKLLVFGGHRSGGCMYIEK